MPVLRGVCVCVFYEDSRWACGDLDEFEQSERPQIPSRDPSTAPFVLVPFQGIAPSDAYECSDLEG